MSDCKLCGKAIRKWWGVQNGNSEKDWSDRKYHKKCWIKLQKFHDWQRRMNAIAEYRNQTQSTYAHVQES